MFLVTSCSTKRPSGNTEAEILFKEANQLIEKGRFILANEKLNSIRSQFPYSFYATPAELLQADILFRQENYVEAAASYMVFKDFHPKYKDMAYVVQRIADSYFYQLPSTFDRDLSPGIEAMKYYDLLIKNYGVTQYAAEAKERITKVESMLESKEIYIADFYFRTEDFSASRTRYAEMIPILKNHNDKLKAMERVLISSLKLKDLTNCEKYFNQYIKTLNKDDKQSLTKHYEACSQQL